MARATHILIVLVLLLLASTARAAEETAPATNPPVSAKTTFESFRILAERNIFNPNRSPRSARRDTSRPRPAPVVQSLSLVGTMSYEKGAFAFFDGSSSEFKKTVRPGDKIAGYNVLEIGPASVTMTNDTRQLDLKVGQQLRREEEGEWQVAAGTALSTPAAPGSESTGESAAPPAASASEEEALKRLMEKRAKELNE